VAGCSSRLQLAIVLQGRKSWPKGQTQGLDSEGALLSILTRVEGGDGHDSGSGLSAVWGRRRSVRRRYETATVGAVR
jgi:hypothetical protein